LAGLEGTFGGMTYMTMKIDPNGNLLWYKTYDNNGPNRSNRINGMDLDAAGNVYVTGSCDDTATFASDIITIKYSALGDSLWLRKFNGPDSLHDTGEKIIVDPNNNVYIAGTVFRASPDNSDWVLLKYDVAGTLLWTQYYDHQPATRSYDAVVDMKLDGNGNPVVVGVISTTNAQATLRYGLVKFNSNGDTLWTAKWGGDGDKKPTELLLDSAGNSYISGNYYDLGGTGYNAVTLKYDANGSLQWQALYNDSTNLEELLFAATLDRNHDLIVAGRQHASLFFDFLTIKYTETATAVTPSEAVTSGDLRCFPNPFAGRTTVQYSLRQPENVSLRLVDAFGKVIALTAAQRQNAGSHQFQLEVGQLEAGIYHLELIAGEQRQRTTVVLLK